jgi:hypothetical protein
MAQRVTVRERIDPAITASLFANYRSSSDAVMELVDNAIDSRLMDSPLDALVQVRRLLSQVLKLTEREEMFRGLAASRSQIAAQTVTRERETANPEAARAPARLPAENEQRRRGFGQVVVRPLDRSIRSQTVIEHEVTTVVINSRHPLFLKRGSDIWHQLETAAGVVFKSLEGASINDYERRVNEVVLLAFQLRARRREARSLRSAAQLPLISS